MAADPGSGADSRPQGLFQAREEGALRLADLRACELQGKEERAVDLREPPPLSRAGRPLQLELVHGQRRVLRAVALEGPRVHGLPAALLDGAERDQRIAGLAADLLAELAPRRREEVLPRLQLALRDRPRAVVLAREEGAARVGEQDLEAAFPAAVDQEAGADPGGHPAGG